MLCFTTKKPTLYEIKARSGYPFLPAGFRQHFSQALNNQGEKFAFQAPVFLTLKSPQETVIS